MSDLLFSIITFVVIYLFYVFFVILRKKKLEKFKKNAYVTFLVTKYNIDLERTNIYVLSNAIALTNAFIVSATLFMISYVSNIFLILILAVVIIIPFQLIMYHIIGKMFGKK